MKKNPPATPIKTAPDLAEAQRVEQDESALFRTTVGAVQPIPEQNRIAPQRPPRKAFVQHSASPMPIADLLTDSCSGDAPEEFLSNGLSRLSLRKLRRGGWPIQDRLDLHGYHSDAARMLLQEFLHDAARNGLRCVLVIHGKGMNSKGGEAVLKLRARHWLMQHPGVLAYCDAPLREGGSGAVLVLLKAAV